jgi:hypothetical protein
LFPALPSAWYGLTGAVSIPALSLRACRLQPFHRALQFLRDLLGIAAGRKSHRLADAHNNLPRSEQTFCHACFTSNNPTIRMGSTGISEIIRQQPNPRAKRIHLAIHRMSSLGKHQHAVSTIHGLTRVSETLPEASFARQRKQIQQRNSQ